MMMIKQVMNGNRPLVKSHQNFIVHLFIIQKLIENSSEFIFFSFDVIDKISQLH